jgi:phosphatidylglycerophosphatase C
VRTAAVFDLDGTISRRDTYLDFLLRMLWRTPKRWLLVHSLALAVCRHKAGFKDNTWLKEEFLRVILGGMAQVVLEKYGRRFADAVMRTGLRPEVQQRIEFHKRKGDLTIMSTASPDLYVRPLAEHLGMDVVHCSRTEWNGAECLTGRLSGGNCYGREKVRRLAALFGTNRRLWNVVIYTDHHSDLPLLLWADEAVVVNPTKRLRRFIRELHLSAEIW